MLPAVAAPIRRQTPMRPQPRQKSKQPPLYQQVAPSIPLVETGSSIGSGILIDGGYVVTNYHVVWPYGQ